MTDSYLTQIEELVKKHDWAVQGVMAGDGDPAFAYSIGLWKNYRHPEIFIVGLDPALAKVVINNCGDKVRRGLTLTEDQVYGDILQAPFKVCFRKIEDVSVGHWFNIARGYYGNYDFEALQMFWPDPEHRFPWDPGYDHDQWPQPMPYDNI